MNPRPPAARRPGIVLATLLCAVFVVLAFALVLTRLAAHEFVHERQAHLETCAAQLAASARDWSRRHPAELTGETPRRLPLDALLPPGVGGEMELHLAPAPGGGTLVLCRLSLDRSGYRLRRALAWPLATPPTPAPPTP